MLSPRAEKITMSPSAQHIQFSPVNSLGVLKFLYFPWLPVSLDWCYRAFAPGAICHAGLLTFLSTGDTLAESDGSSASKILSCKSAYKAENCLFIWKHSYSWGSETAMSISWKEIMIFLSNAETLVSIINGIKLCENFTLYYYSTSKGFGIFGFF